MSDKKYELTDEKIKWEGRTLYRIRALKDFGYIKAGDLGGWVESEYNLSQEDNCWVCDDAKVYGDAMVYDDAWIYGNAMVRDDAQVHGCAQVCDRAWVYGKAWVCDDAKVYGDTVVNGNMTMSGI